MKDFLKRLAAWLFAMTHKDELDEISWRVRYQFQAFDIVTMQDAREYRDNRLRAMATVDTLHKLDLIERG